MQADSAGLPPGRGAELQAIVSSLPPVAAAFAYGSGVFAQPGLYPGGSLSSPAGPGGLDLPSPMLDFLLAVEDPLDWHTQNLERHRSHYSLLASLGPGAVVGVAERIGAGVYFNTLVPWRKRVIKYGVTSMAGLQQDLLTWRALFLAGRLHKPTVALGGGGARPPGLEAALRANLEGALRASLLLLPARFGTEELLHMLCALSYQGDLRMGLAEDGRKVERIVAGSEAQLRRMYAPPVLAAVGHWRLLHPSGPGALLAPGPGREACVPGNSTWYQDDSPAAQGCLLAALPSAVAQRVAARLATAPELAGRGGPGAGAEAYAALLASRAGRRRMQHALRHALASIVGASSRRQALAGLLSAGLVKSARYAAGKLAKAWR